MALQNKDDELLTAWRALSNDLQIEGWLTIPISHRGQCKLLAGRHCPSNEEALLVGFTSAHMPLNSSLPEGQGFIVSKADLGADGGDLVWVALCRQAAGNLELFTMMANDVMLNLENYSSSESKKLFNNFLTRIRAWQDFMHNRKDTVLSAEAEIGLCGELTFLCDLIETGLSAGLAVDAWQGPLNGLQDFVIGTGAIEIKTTVASVGFRAKIGSLEQLDNSLIDPLYLAAVRLLLSPAGKTLPEIIKAVSLLIQEDGSILNDFNSRLLHAGYLENSAGYYTRQFIRVGTKLLHISNSFPRLTRQNVPIQIYSARYEIDLDLIPSDTLNTEAALKKLGVI